MFSIVFPSPRNTNGFSSRPLLLLFFFVSTNLVLVNLVLLESKVGGGILHHPGALVARMVILPQPPVATLSVRDALLLLHRLEGSFA